MLLIQLTQVLITRPERGRAFWNIVSYSTVVFVLATVAIGGKLKFAELAYVENNIDPMNFFLQSGNNMNNMISQISFNSATLIPWVGDVIMLYRVVVVWNYRWWLIVLPTIIYLARVSMSVPLLIAQIHPQNSNWAAHSLTYGTIFYALCFSLNTIFSTLICVRLYMMRPKVEHVLGKLHASFYTSWITMFVESGAFFTVWSMCYVISLARNSWIQEVFLQPYPYMLSLTRILIILRMAQDRAWSEDIVTATITGVLDWQVSSSNSLPLHDVPAASHQHKILPKKYREDTISM
ncbi:hypothetical protein BDQ12DRAFT_604405 [Crucibulum laeve]|uniref:Uncharacterized protein n=1 Tax=Crucibulum laeve TaxID=68775 RepID=A0A5C3M5Q7_9AGAR|nr:hypothetical protein BDQ12DRAFT_604405 [Crucibulum laeve]